MLVFAMLATLPLGGIGLATAAAEEPSTQTKLLAVGAMAECFSNGEHVLPSSTAIRQACATY